MYWNKALRHLNWDVILNLLGYVLSTTGVLMLLPMIVALIYQEESWQSFLYSILICLIIGIQMTRVPA